MKPRRDQWNEWIERALDGRLDADEQAAFEAAVVEDSELRRAYVEAARLEACLRVVGGEEAAALESAAGPPRRLKSRHLLVPLAAAAVAAIGAWWLGYAQAGSERPKPVARVSEASGCKWGGSLLPTAEGSILEPGKLDLREGIATLVFDSGAEVMLEAPAEVELLSPLALKLVRGSVVADVPESAIGFTVHTPNGEVVDYGTRFGVTYGARGQSHVTVFDGEVGLRGKGGSEERRLLGGDSEFLGERRDQLVAGDEPVGAGEMLAGWEAEGWSTLTTRDGQGGDSYVSPNPSKDANHGSEPLVLVKHSETQLGNIRYAFLGFDLATLDGEGALKDAELALQVAPSGLGLGSMVPDSVFVVHGLPRANGSGWDEDSITLANAPAHLGEGELDTTRMVELGRFSVARGIVSGSRTVGGPDLIEFLESQRGGIATLVISRVTGEFARAGLVHAFASKEHPSSAAPTLKLKFE